MNFIFSNKGKIIAIMVLLLIGSFSFLNWESIPETSARGLFEGCIDKDAKRTFDVQQLFTKSLTTYSSGQQEDYCYTFPSTGKTYLMEGVCSDGNFQIWQKNCAELNVGDSTNYQCINGACQDKNNSVVELKIGESISSLQGAVLTITKVFASNNGSDNSFANFSLERPFSGKLVAEGKNLFIGYSDKYLDKFGFHILFLGVNNSTNKVKLQVFSNCTAAYNACLKNNDIKNSLVMNSCDTVCYDEKVPGEVSNNKGKITGFYKNSPVLYKNLGQHLTDSFDFCYNQVKSYLGFDFPYSKIYIKSVYGPNAGSSVSDNIIKVGTIDVNNDFLNSFQIIKVSKHHSVNNFIRTTVAEATPRPVV